MPRRLLMAEQWDQFSRAIFRDGTPATQRREMKRAFYAGAQAILFKVISAFAPEEEVTDADLQIMTDLQTELNEFAEAVKKGLA